VSRAISQPQRRWRSPPNHFNSVCLLFWPGIWPETGRLAGRNAKEQNAGLELDRNWTQILRLDFCSSGSCSSCGLRDAAKQQAATRRRFVWLLGAARPAVATPMGGRLCAARSWIGALFPWCSTSRTVSDTAPTPRTWPANEERGAPCTLQAAARKIREIHAPLQRSLLPCCILNRSSCLISFHANRNSLARFLLSISIMT
jgi:hypothetical protein